jgi:hypothetical protein
MGFILNIIRPYSSVVERQSCKLNILLFISLFSTFLAGASALSTGMAESDVLKALSQIIDPDFGTDIVSCGFVKDLHINEASGEVI